jgi:hypothetical protein
MKIPEHQYEKIHKHTRGYNEKSINIHINILDRISGNVNDEPEP